MNELLWFLMMALNFGAIILAYRFFGKIGLFIWVPIAVILANIQVIKEVNLFGLSATLGNIIYATSFLATDILSENYGKKEARKAVYIGFFAILAMTLFMNISLYFKPGENDWAQEHLSAVFSIMPRIALASILAYAVSQMHDVWAYDFWRDRAPGKKLIWIRNNASTWVSQLIDSVVFVFVAFLGEFPLSVLFQILVTTYFLKVIVAAADTPFVYIARYWKDKGIVEDQVIEKLHE